MEVIRRINRGGFGIVEEVRLDDGRHVARKSYAPDIDSDTEGEAKLRQRFAREVRIQSELNSNAFLPVIGHDLTADPPWFLMPLAERNLADEIRRCKAIGETPVQALADTLNALEELHSLGFVHRDLKPENILLLDGVWRLSDFGLVLTDTGRTTRLTSTRSAWGTQMYAAPEQAIQFKYVGATADIFAFGCILHDIFGDEERIPFHRCTTGGDLGPILEKCTEIKPERRFRSASALRLALLPILTNEPFATTSASAIQWKDKLSGEDEWTIEEAQSFLRHIIGLDVGRERSELFSLVNHHTIESFLRVDFDCWKTLAVEYCEWVGVTGFPFAFCDVIIDRLLFIYENDRNIETKALAIIAGAQMAQTHNRWYVMKQVLSLCGPSLWDDLAKRVVIEIRARQIAYSFIRCAEGISRSLEDYHPLIRSVLLSEVD